MPEYRAPGVYIEETSSIAPAIAAVNTHVTAFVGPCRFGPVGGVPELLTSYADFERLHGGLAALDFGITDPAPNYLAHAVRVFFEEGGKKLHVARVYSPPGGSDGIARWTSNHSASSLSAQAKIELSARYAGADGNMLLTLELKKGQSKIRVNRRGKTKLTGVEEGDVVWAQTLEAAANTPPVPGRFYRVQRQRRGLRLGNDSSAAGKLLKARLFETVNAVSVTVRVTAPGQAWSGQALADMVFDPARANSLSQAFAPQPGAGVAGGSIPLVLAADGASGDQIAAAFARLPNDDDGTTIADCLDSSNPTARSVTLQLSDGSDGRAPTAADYSGSSSNADVTQGLEALQALADIAIVAAPGASASPNGAADAASIARALIAHCEQQRYRMAVLDSPQGATANEVRAARQGIDSSRAALYYPWVQILDPLTNLSMLNPPSGHICGIYARNDINRGVHKAPANEVIRLATDLEFTIESAQQDVLNPEGINCLRFFPGRGYRVWGARTASSDPEWKYINVRRYLSYLERSIDAGTQWVVFENNGELLWSRVRVAIENFLNSEWRSGGFQGDRVDAAYFVKCDRTTMTQNDLDNGRLICQIGVAVVKPAEFVIFRIGQKTSDSAT